MSATTSFNALGAGFYCANGTGSITSNGVSFPKFKLNKNTAVFTLTLNDILNVVDIVTDFNGSVTNGFSVSVNGSMTLITASFSGNTIYNLIGTGNFGTNSAAALIASTVNINTLGTITLLSFLRFTGGTLNYIAGNVNTTINSSILDLYANNSITSKNGANEIIFNNVRAAFTGALGTTTLGSDMRVTGNFTVSQQNGYNFNGNTIFIGGNILNPTGTANGGTSVMVMEGPANATISAGNLTRSLTISKSGGATVTLLGNLTYGVVGVSRTLTINTPLDVISNSTTITAGGTPLTITNSYGSQFFNLTITATTTLNIN
jgi:hypothetical protein